MSNPLQPKVVRILEDQYSAFSVIVTSTARSGVMDVLACIPYEVNFSPVSDKIDALKPARCITDNTVGLFFGFEVKWKNDRPNELQKQKINKLITSGGYGYFVKNEVQLHQILQNPLEHLMRYDTKIRAYL